MVGILNNGEKYKVDVEDYERLVGKTCYPNKEQISIRVNKKQMQLSRYILSAYYTGVSRCYFRNKDTHDFRKANLYFGNDVVFYNDSFCVLTDLAGKEFTVDLDDYDKISRYRWHVDKNNYVICARGLNGRDFKMHRLIMGVLEDNTVEIDHINRNTTDNRKTNLRIATRSQNCINRDLTHGNASGKVGVYHTKYGGWCAQINNDGVRHYLGYYRTFDEAVEARVEAEKALHKEFTPKI